MSRRRVHFTELDSETLRYVIAANISSPAYDRLLVQKGQDPEALRELYWKHLAESRVKEDQVQKIDQDSQDEDRYVYMHFLAQQNQRMGQNLEGNFLLFNLTERYIPEPPGWTPNDYTDELEALYLLCRLENERIILEYYIYRYDYDTDFNTYTYAREFVHVDGPRLATLETQGEFSNARGESFLITLSKTIKEEKMDKKHRKTIIERTEEWQEPYILSDLFIKHFEAVPIFTEKFGAREVIRALNLEEKALLAAD